MDFTFFLIIDLFILYWTTRRYIIVICYRINACLAAKCTGWNNVRERLLWSQNVYDAAPTIGALKLTGQGGQAVAIRIFCELQMPNFANLMP